MFWLPALIIFGNNTDHSTAFRAAGEDEIIVENEAYMLKRSNESCVITFSSGIYSSGNDVIPVVSSSNEDVKGAEEYDDDDDDDDKPLIWWSVFSPDETFQVDWAVQWTSSKGAAQIPLIELE